MLSTEIGWTLAKITGSDMHICLYKISQEHETDLLLLFL